MTDFSSWIGKTEARSDRLDVARTRALLAALGGDDAHGEGDVMPPLFHWLYFWDLPRLDQTDVDGHRKRGGFLPPVEARRRMWAAGSVRFLAPLSLGAPAKLTSTILSIETKAGRSGALTFVTVGHAISVEGGAPAIEEEQVMVYRDAAGGAAPQAPPTHAVEWRETIVPDVVLLFRYSALTLNSHRIHYDQNYVRDVEHYPGLLVHGPLQATLLANLLAKGLKKPLRKFTYRAVAPAFEGTPLDVKGVRTDEGGEAWVEQAGGVTMVGKALA